MRSRAAGDRERGSATVWVLAAATLILSVAILAIVIGAAATARRRAEATADLAALAGAGRIGTAGDPCSAADQVSRANGADLITCATQLSVDGRTGSVRVGVALPFTLAVLGHRDARARSVAARVAFGAEGARGAAPP